MSTSAGSDSASILNSSRLLPRMTGTRIVLLAPRKDRHQILGRQHHAVTEQVRHGGQPQQSRIVLGEDGRGALRAQELRQFLVGVMRSCNALASCRVAARPAFTSRRLVPLPARCSRGRARCRPRSSALRRLA